jgi:hydroxyquinol 1,2-dioxygenase
MRQLDGAPLLALGSHIAAGDLADAIAVSGRVGDPNGKPIAGAMIDVRQASSTGHYDSQDLTPEGPGLRARFLTDADGRYSFHTVLGHRPGLILFRLSAPGYQELVTVLYIADDPHLESDAVFAVSPAFLIAAQPRISYNFVLARATAASEPS